MVGLRWPSWLFQLPIFGIPGVEHGFLLGDALVLALVHRVEGRELVDVGADLLLDADQVFEAYIGQILRRQLGGWVDAVDLLGQLELVA